MPSNKSIIFKAVPDGYPVAGEHMELVTKEIDIENFSLADERYSSYEIGQVLDGYGIAIVVKSNNKKYQVGDYFVGLIGWEEYSHITANVVSAEALAKEIFTKFKVPESHFIGLLGIPGMSAYVGLNKIGQPKKAASGAVGQVVGQIAKIKGLRVIGSASDDSKIKYLEEELKFDGAFNYKTCNVDKKLKELCPNGIDIYFDNVGGETLDIVINHLNNFARVVACGMISQYNTKDHYGVKNLIQIIGKRVLIQGFIVSDHFQEMESFRKEMVEWFKQGKLKYKEDIVEGIQNAPQALINILTGKKFGKMIVKIC
ncbi:8575_t:CDS:2 [Gigaspora margarita]|uniref:8575_t:CDS:1 n=1 Tax=Gigaspora margarita TaxID=4874 RepID=A0ABN7UIH7_GIGMA|nr:8575_t:CDS:2 [Gigaspora margarita]